MTSQKRGTRCTILRSVGQLTIRNGQAGSNTVRFSGRLAGKALAPGSYRATTTPARGEARTTQLTILRARTKHAR